MPELPEVETTMQAISPYVMNALVKNVQVFQPKLRWQVSDEIKNLFVGKPILKCWRRGKYLLLEQADGACMIHLGMSGKLRIAELGDEMKLHDHVVFIFDEFQIHFNDPRRFGSVLWVSAPILEHKLLVSLGPEPLCPDFDLDYLYEKTRNKKAGVKSWLMNANNVVGVGNIYANEALFYAKILPFRIAGSLSRHDCEQLVFFVKQVLRQAILAGGTTLKDFLAPNNELGYFQQQLSVYGRAGEKCLNCDFDVKSMKINQRASFWCDNCQA